MARYELHCDPQDAIASQNCRVLAGGRISILFVEKSKAEHDEVVTGLHDDMTKAVVGELATNPAFLKYARAMKDLDSATAELNAMRIDEKSDSLTKERKRLVDEMPAGVALKISTIDAKADRLCKDAEAVRGRIAFLTEAIKSLRPECEVIAANYASRVVAEKTALFNQNEVETSAYLSKVAGPSVAKLANIKNSKLRIGSYHANADFARHFVDAALAAM